LGQQRFDLKLGQGRSLGLEEAFDFALQPISLGSL
jgi:hypothetical protein